MKVRAGNRGWQSKGDAMAWLHTVVSSSSLYALLFSQLGVRVNCRLRSNVHRLSYLPLVRYARGIYEGLAMKAGLQQNACKIQSIDTEGSMYRRTRKRGRRQGNVVEI